MIKQLLEALRQRKDIQGWTLRHVVIKDEQLYLVPAGKEATRTVNSEMFEVEVLRTSKNKVGELTSGAGNITVLPGDDIHTALDQAALTASLVHNPPYNLPEPAETPKVAIADPYLQGDPSGVLQEVCTTLEQASRAHRSVRMTAAELYATETSTHLWNSRGLDLEQTGTKLAIEWVLISRGDGEEMESYLEMTRRRASDYDLEAEMEHQARLAMDSLTAGPARPYLGPVVIRGRTLADFLTSDVIQAMSSAASKYSQQTTWEIGKSVFKKDSTGEPFTAWANRQLPYGLNSNSFDGEGLPARRIELIRDNLLVKYTASQRYAEYLKIPATGDFGNLELPAGSIPSARLLDQPHVEIAEFSWFNPDDLTGDFSCEIRLGYIVDGASRIPFKGGQLVGNVMDALADVHWSQEMNFPGNYFGPKLARFEGMRIAA